jgi:hypothetical protein
MVGFRCEIVNILHRVTTSTVIRPLTLTAMGRGKININKDK